MSDLPPSWVQPTIGEICDLINGRAFKPTDWSESGLPIVRIQNLNDPNAKFNHFDGEVRPQFLIDRGQLLFAWSGTPGTSFGAHVWKGGPGVLNQHIFRVEFPEHLIDKTFFAHAINQKLNELIGKAHGGVGLRHVTKSKFEETEIALPPLAEQRRIVAKLDALTARTARARADLDRVPALAERQRQAILKAAFNGEFPSQPSDGTTWPTRLVGEVITKVTGGKNLRCEERPPTTGEKGVVKVSAVSWGVFDPRASKTLPREFLPPAHTKITSGDFLISRANTLELVGAVVVVEETPDNLFLSDKVLRLEMPADGKRWLMWYLRSPEGRAAIQAGSSGNQLSMRNLSQDALRRISVPWPALAVRQNIVARIEGAFAEIDRLAAEAAAARRLLDRLDQGVLAKAFRGELVPQDPDDEPASVLLERIRAERAAAPAKTRRGRQPVAADVS